MRPGFSRVHGNQRVRLGMILVQIKPDRAANRVQRRVVQRRCSGDTSDAVGAKKLFGHKGKGRTCKPCVHITAAGGALPQKSLAQRSVASLSASAVGLWKLHGTPQIRRLAWCATLNV